jgi:hypothetical protein
MSEPIAATVLILGLALCVGPLVLAVRARRPVWIALSALWLLISLVPLSAFASPELTYWAAWARCGHQPAIASNFAARYSYDLPGDSNYGPSLFVAAYFCTTTQAEDAGYHRGLGQAK